MEVRLSVQLQGDSLRLAADSSSWEHVSFTQAKGMSVCGVGATPLADQQTLSNISLPIKPDADECAYAITYQGQTDTLYLAYTREETYVSLACGCAVFALLDSVYSSTRFIDSLEVLNTAVSTAAEKHIKLYFHQTQPYL